MPEERTGRTGRVIRRLRDSITNALAGDHPAPVPDEQLALMLDELLAVPDAVRDMAFILLAYSVEAGRAVNVVDPEGGDLGANMRLPGDRTISDNLRSFLRSNGIEARASAVESSTFRGGYRPAQADRPIILEFVDWLSGPGRSVAELSDAFDFMASGIAATARVVPALPPIDSRRCTFPRVTVVIDLLLERPSQGHYEQYLLGAFLRAVHEQRDDRHLVSTKAVATTDRSAGSAGDIEVRLGQNLSDAIEVSAASWKDKVVQAVSSLERRVELDRIHIVAKGTPLGMEILAELAEADLPPGVDALAVDLTVQDVRQAVLSLCAEASRLSRRAAIEHLHELLRRHRSPVELTQYLVDSVSQAGLVE